MQGLLGRVSACFTGGVFGGLLASVGAWMAGRYGWTAALGVTIAPEWDAAWIFPRLLWSGLWGLVFVPDVGGASIFWRGLLLSLGPTLVQLFILYPDQDGAGLAGLGLGAWTPLVVLLTNALWGWGTAVWVRLAAGEDDRQRYGRLH